MLSELGVQRYTVSVSIRTAWRCVMGKGLKIRFEAQAKMETLIIRMTVLFALHDQQWGGEQESPHHKGPYSVKESMIPDEQPWGSPAQTRKCLNFLISSRPHRLEEMTSKKCNCYAFRWKLLKITLNSKPNWNMRSNSLAKLCVILISSSHSGHTLWGSTFGILEAFCYK